MTPTGQEHRAATVGQVVSGAGQRQACEADALCLGKGIVRARCAARASAPAPSPQPATPPQGPCCREEPRSSGRAMRRQPPNSKGQQGCRWGGTRPVRLLRDIRPEYRSGDLSVADRRDDFPEVVEQSANHHLLVRAWPSARLSLCCTPSPFSRRFNRDDEGVPAE